jgi:hypothetical protein
MSAIKKGKRHSEESKRKQSEIAKSRGIGKWNLGIKKSFQTKIKMSESAAQRPRKLCPKCNQGYTNANYDKHFNSCNGQKQILYKKCEDGIMRRVVE